MKSKENQATKMTKNITKMKLPKFVMSRALVTSIKIGKFCQVFVAFLENMIFKKKIALKLHLTAKKKKTWLFGVFIFEEMEYVLLNQT